MNLHGLGPQPAIPIAILLKIPILWNVSRIIAITLHIELLHSVVVFANFSRSNPTIVHFSIPDEALAVLSAVADSVGATAAKGFILHVSTIDEVWPLLGIFCFNAFVQNRWS